MPIRRLVFSFVLAAAVLAAPAAGQGLPATEIRLVTDPADGRVRPLESLVIQVLVYGESAERYGDEVRRETVRLRQGGALCEIRGENAGWLSKPFRYQAKEDEPFYEMQGGGLGAIVLQRAREQYVLQDAFLYTAPEKPGRYEVTCKLDEFTASAEVAVDPDAPSRKTAERWRFPPEPPSEDPRFDLVEHYAPMVAQETWFEPKSDYLARFDLDGDWEGFNNWENAAEGSSQAYVYYAVMETRTHWFLIYNFFHPRDYSDKCVAGTCHENDNEGAILCVEKDGTNYGRLRAMETLAHNNLYSYRADGSVRSGVHNLDGEMELHDGSHPVLFIEAGGHGVYGSADSHSLYNFAADRFESSTGVTYVYKGKAEKPRHAADRRVGYALLPVYEHWWLRAHEGDGRNVTFDDYFVYRPHGRRPVPVYPEIAGAFLGRTHASNSAKPFWGWHDRRTQSKKVAARGQWGLDPAYVMSQNLEFPEPFSTDYVFNPYLGKGTAPLTELTEAEAQTVPSQPEMGPEGPPPGPLRRPVPEALQASAGFDAPRSEDYDPDSREGEFDIRLHVDGEVEVFVQGGRVRYEVVSGETPRDDGSEYTQTLPAAVFEKFELEQKDGRGEIVLLETPSAENGFTARLRIADPREGEDRYHARLRWKWSELREQPDASPRNARPGGSSILDRHLGHLGDSGEAAEGEGESSPARSEPPAPASEPAARPRPAEMPGEELFSEENDPARYDDAREGRFEFRGRVDGAVIFRIRGDRVFAEALNGGPVQVERFSFTQPVPEELMRSVEIEQRGGRGEVVLLEKPWPGNRYTAVIHVSDPRSGDDRYHFRLDWRR